MCSGGAGFAPLGPLVSRLSFWKGEGVEEKGKSPKCKTWYQITYSDPTTGAAWVGCKVVLQDLQAPSPGVCQRAEPGEEDELTLETERQMVTGGGWPCASALWLKDRQNSDLRVCTWGEGRGAELGSRRRQGRTLRGDRAFPCTLKKAPRRVSVAPPEPASGAGPCCD